VGPLVMGALVDLSGNGLAAWTMAAVGLVAATSFALLAKETVGRRASWKPPAGFLVSEPVGQP
jgi:hypothetical protein